MDSVSILSIVCLILAVVLFSMLVLFNYIVEDLRSTTAYWVILICAIILAVISFTIMVKNGLLFPQNVAC